MIWIWPRRERMVSSRTAQYTHSTKPAACIRAITPKAMEAMPMRLRRRCRSTLRRAIKRSVSKAGRSYRRRVGTIVASAGWPSTIGPFAGDSVSAFDYDAAFTRNIGWLTPAEQQRLRRARVAIAGLGGVGGFHLLTLVRLGIGAFTLAEFDRFGLANFNRQAGAMMSTVGRPKLDVMIDMARDINPELDIRTFPEGVQPHNIDEFLRDVDVYVDGLDFFAFAARRMTFGACARLGVPATTAAPIGMGVALLNFLPDGMSFEDYF